MNALRIWKDILAQGQYLFRAGLVTALILLASVLYPDGRSGAGQRLRRLLKRPWRIAFAFYCVFILTSTVLGRSFVNPTEHVLTHFGFTHQGAFNDQLVENILFFIPLTFFYLNAFPVRHPFRNALQLSVGMTLLVEMCQLLGRLGEFQLADMAQNIVGGLLGWALWRLTRILFPSGRSSRENGL